MKSVRIYGLVMVLTVLTLGAAGKASADENLQPVTIQVNDGLAGEPLEGMVVKITSLTSGDVWTCNTTSGGVAKASLPPGDYKIRAGLRLFGFPLMIGSFSLTVDGPTSAEIELSSLFVPVKYVPIIVYVITALLIALILYSVGKRVYRSLRGQENH